MFAFWLGREYKLSIAELWAVFPKANFEYISKDFAIVGKITKQDALNCASKLGGTIKILELFPDYRGNPSDIILKSASKHEGKFAYGISYFGGDTNLKKILIDTKKVLKQESISSRFVNKDFKNLSSAQIIGEKLVERLSDYSIIDTGDVEYLGRTIWVQDIENYSKRDFGKTRDMQVGMLPPKLAQMMINFASLRHSCEGRNLSKRDSGISSKTGMTDVRIYDPFCGLGTILIESMIMGNSAVYGSDISPEMVKATRDNINFTRKNFQTHIKTTEVIELDARGISSSPLLKFSDCIVTEGYLGQVFQKYSVTEKKIEEEKQKLLLIYKDFFFGLSKAKYKGIIVISFPFWEIRGKYHYFSEIYKVIEQYCKKEHFLPLHDEIKHTKSGSLLYKRPDQIVGREIFKLTIN